MRLRPTLLLPLLAAGVGAALLVSSHLELQEVLRRVRHSFEAHVESVTGLVRDAARQATTALDLAYALSEEELASSARFLMAQEREGPPGEGTGVVVWVTGGGPDDLGGTWGPVTAGQRGALVEEVLDAEDGELVEGPTVRTLGLYCAHYRFRSRLHLVCKDLRELRKLRRETGVGRLLADLASSDLLYVALQDRGTLLAKTRGAEVPLLDGDSFLEEAVAQEGTAFRRLTWKGRSLFEGATRFPLPDGSTPVLRVGIDAAPLREVEARVASRQRWQLLVVILLVLSAAGVAGVLDRRERQRREAEASLHEQQEEQRHWRTIGQMAATVAHEVRGPLSTIKMTAQRLPREFAVPDDDQDDFRELTAMLRVEADRLDRVVTDFLDLGRPLALTLETIPAAMAISESVAPLRLRAQEGGRAVEERCDSDDDVRLDRRRFAQIIRNLVGNALDASPVAGVVTVTGTCRRGELVVTVADNGEGMDADTLARVQEAFVSMKSGGTGLGLPLARRLTEAHGGRLTVSSTLGEGTQVEVRLPLRGPKER